MEAAERIVANSTLREPGTIESFTFHSMHSNLKSANMEG